MFTRSPGTFLRTIESRTPIIEPLIAIAIVSLVTSWAIQPYVAQALTQQGAVAQGAAQAAIWLSGVLSPFMALAKALAAAAVCWACAVFLGERLQPLKLISVFCVAEALFSLRDLALWGVLTSRGIEYIHSPADLMVAFGLNVFVRSPSPVSRIALESWDLFTVLWGFAIWWMLRRSLRTDLKTSAALALLVFLVRALFAAASLLYSL